jgi:hypothetical protein
MRVQNVSPQGVPDGLYVPALAALLPAGAIWPAGEVIEIPDEIAETLLGDDFAEAAPPAGTSPPVFAPSEGTPS